MQSIQQEENRCNFFCVCVLQPKMTCEHAELTPSNFEHMSVDFSFYLRLAWCIWFGWLSFILNHITPFTHPLVIFSCQLWKTKQFIINVSYFLRRLGFKSRAFSLCPLALGIFAPACLASNRLYQYIYIVKLQWLQHFGTMTTCSRPGSSSQ